MHPGVPAELEPLASVLATVQGFFVVVSLLAVMAAMGTQLTRGDLRRTVREYDLVLRWIATNVLAVPLFAVLFDVLFGLPEPIRLGMLLVAIAPGAPFIPLLVSIAGEDSGEAIRLTAALTLVAAIAVPLLVTAGLWVFRIEAAFPPLRFLLSLLLVLVAPLVVGFLVRERRPASADVLARRLRALGNLSLLLALVLVVLLDFGGALRVFVTLFGTGMLLVLVLFVFATLGAGFLVGGTTRRSRRILALGTAGRNVGVALFVARGAFPRSGANATIVAFAVLMFVLSVLLAVYWRRRRPARIRSPGDEGMPGEP